MKPAHFSLTGKLVCIGMLLVGSLAGVVGLAWKLLPGEQGAGAELALYAQAQRSAQEVDMAHDALRSHVLAALLVPPGAAPEADKVLEALRADARVFHAELGTLDRLGLDASLRPVVAQARDAGERYAELAEVLGPLAVRDRAAALRRIGDFDVAFEEAKQALAAQVDAFARAGQAAHQRADEAATRARQLVLVAGLAAMALAAVSIGLIARSIRRSLGSLRDVAHAIADGRLEERATVLAADEVGQLARSLNRMAAHLQEVIERMRDEAERGGFSGELVQALEMVDSEPAVCEAVGRAMLAVSPDHPMELLIADSSEAHLERAAVHPERGAPGCGVESPFTCIAVRRGNPVVFGDSEALNACPQLRGRECGPVSAVCVPVTFMGRALGVLHATGSVGQPLGGAQADRLTTLGIQAGGRIGTVRAFERTQMQASTDALTGLANRRTLEDAARRIAAGPAPFAFVLADLDHFKKLNDTFGHQAGDDALRLFADVVRAGVRGGDVAARWGGEEFAFLLVDVGATEALIWTERIRTALAEELARRGGPAFTASFGVTDAGMARKLATLTTLADDALYRAKHEGRDRACAADPAGLLKRPERPASEQRAAVNLRMLAG
jgi:diguanylate cyclase (GGDEF)-like protein